MTDNDLRAAFSTFRDLNLAFLARDLEHGLVAVGAWCDRNLLCPMAHGCDMVSGGPYADGVAEIDAVVQQLHISGVLVRAFTRWWDAVYDVGTHKYLDTVGKQYTRLLGVVRGIMAERLADADAVQGVLGAQSTAVTVGETPKVSV